MFYWVLGMFYWVLGMFYWVLSNAFWKISFRKKQAERWLHFHIFWKISLIEKVSKYGVFSGPYFPAFELNTERYKISPRIQSKCGKIQTRKFGHLSHSVCQCFWVGSLTYSMTLPKCPSLVCHVSMTLSQYILIILKF